MGQATARGSFMSDVNYGEFAKAAGLTIDGFMRTVQVYGEGGGRHPVRAWAQTHTPVSSARRLNKRHQVPTHVGAGA